MKSEQYQGKIKQYNAEKGYGFIAAPEGEVFSISRIFLRLKASQSAMIGLNLMWFKMVIVIKPLILNL